MDTPTLTDEQKAELLEIQFLTAKAGSEALQIHLGKAYLGQHDKHIVQVDQVPMADKSYEQLLEMLEDRQKALPDERLIYELEVSGRPALAPIACESAAPLVEPPKKRKVKKS